jgi:hypothetical protein
VPTELGKGVGSLLEQDFKPNRQAVPFTSLCVPTLLAAGQCRGKIVRLLHLESILVAECFSLDLPCGGSYSEMLTTLKHQLMASINSLMTALMASINGVH